MQYEKISDTELKVTQEHTYTITKTELETRKADAERRIKEAQTEIEEIDKKLAILKGEDDADKTV